jgi:hypothetical protein
MSCNLLVLPGSLGIVEILRWFAVLSEEASQCLGYQERAAKYIPDAEQRVLLMERSKMREIFRERESLKASFRQRPDLAFHT